MPLTLARGICFFYGALLAAIGLAMAIYPWNILFVVGLWAAAVGLALRYRWAFWSGYAVGMLCLVQSAGDLLAVRLPLRNLFRQNLARHYLLESPSQFFFWYGIPKPITEIILCIAALAALAWAHRTLAAQGLLRSTTDRVGLQFFVTVVSIVSKAALAIALAVIAYALWKDPPTGGHNPGGFGPGTLLIYAVIFAGPWLLAGAAGWAFAAWLRRRTMEQDGSSAAETDRSNS
jgi:hypothetical protein